MQMTRKPYKYKDYFIIAAIILVALILGAVFQVLPLGQIAIVAYGLIALIRKIPSKISFIAALIFITVSFTLAMFGQTGFVAQNFATYSFMLLCVGVVTAALELRHTIPKRILISEEVKHKQIHL